MADNDINLMQTPEYMAFANNMTKYSNGETPSLEKFLASMSPQERAEFEKKYQVENLEANENPDKEDNSAKKDKEETLDDNLKTIPDIERVRSQYSDLNEIWLDRIRVKVLQSMNKVDANLDVDNLTVEALIEEVKKADSLKDDEQKQYDQEVMKSLRSEINFSLVPPKALVAMEKQANEEIKQLKNKDKNANTATQEAVLNGVRNRMDNLIKDMAEQTGLYFVDKSNIADVYDGYMEMIASREKENEFVNQAKEKMQPMMDKYNQDFGLAGKTPKDAKELMKIAKDTAQKMDDFELSPENLKIAQSLHFKDDKGNDVPQFLDDAGKPAMVGTKVRPGTQLETILNAAKSDALDDQVLILGKTAEKKDIHAAVNASFELNTTMMVNADRIANRDKPVPFNTLRNNLQNGTVYNVSQAGFEGAIDAYTNKKTTKLAQLGKKIGDNAPVISTLYEPIKKIDKLEQARFDESGNAKKYSKQFWAGWAGNVALVAAVAGSFEVAKHIPGAQPYCVYASAGLAMVGMTVAYQQRRRAAHAEGKKYNFFKDPEGMSSVLMSAAAFGAVAWGRPEGMYAIMGANMVRNGYFAHKKAKKAGVKGGHAALMTVAAVAATPLGAWIGHEAGSAIGNALSAENGPFGHWMQKDGEIIPGEKHDVKTYEQKHIDKAETWNNSDGEHSGARYTPDGSKPMESVFHKTGTYQDALTNLQTHHEGWAPEAADVNMAKLENAHLLGAPTTPLAHDPSHTLGDIMGATDANGNHVTYEDVFKHLTTNPNTPLSPAEVKVMDLVALHMSADANGHMGHLIPDVGIKPQDLYSYDPSRPDGIIHNITQDEAKIIPGEKVWVPNPTQDIVPHIPPYFFAQVQKLKKIKEKIGSLADKILKRKDKDEVIGIKPPHKNQDEVIGIIPPHKNQDDVIGIVPPVKGTPGDTIVTKPDPKNPESWDLSGLQGDNVYYGPTSGDVAYNEVEGLEDKEAVAKKIENKQPDKKRYELTEKDMASKEYSEALSKAMSGDANAIEAYRKMREAEVQKFEEMRDHVQSRKAELKANKHQHKDKMHGSVVADRFAEEDIHGVEMSENTPAEYKRVEKQRGADKEEFKKTGTIQRFMKLFEKEK